MRHKHKHPFPFRSLTLITDMCLAEQPLLLTCAACLWLGSTMVANFHATVAWPLGPRSPHVPCAAVCGAPPVCCHGICWIKKWLLICVLPLMPCCCHVIHPSPCLFHCHTRNAPPPHTPPCPLNRTATWSSSSDQHHRGGLRQA
jgi:hypothetical protein